MEKVFSVAQVIAPIFVAITMGMLARRKKLLTAEGVQGMQQFVMKFGLPCVIFNSCLTADIGAEALSSMAMAIPMVLIGTFWAFWAKKKKFPYHNLPQMFTAQETGMLGIPLFMILFGVDQAYRVGVLDLAQSVTAIPVIAILSTDTGENPSLGQIVKKVVTSPLLIMSILGLALNLSGIGAWMDSVGIGAVVTESTSFLAQPVSAMMIFCVGYNFSITEGNRGVICRIALIHFCYYALCGAIVQAVLYLIPGMDALTRWAMLLYCALPASYLAPTLGRSEEDKSVASGVCSILTVVSLAVFCVMAVIVS